jgi:transcriptional regulator with XRE-family HTH domain
MMNDRERAICARVKEFREDIKWPQPAFANEIGISRDQLANIEYARVPLKFGVCVTMCRVFDVNAEWLVTGDGKKSGAQPFLWSVKFKHEQYSMPLSAVFDSGPDAFKPPELELFLASTPTPGFDPQSYLIKEVVLCFQLNKFRTPLQAENFARDVALYAQGSLRMLRQIGKSTRFHSSTKKTGLTNSSLKSNNDFVKSEIEKLIERVKRAVKKPGMKAALARELHIAPARISEWLAGDKEPGGDYALTLLQWVEQQERQK